MTVTQDDHQDCHQRKKKAKETDALLSSPSKAEKSSSSSSRPPSYHQHISIDEDDDDDDSSALSATHKESGGSSMKSCWIFMSYPRMMTALAASFLILIGGVVVARHRKKHPATPGTVLCGPDIIEEDGITKLKNESYLEVQRVKYGVVAADHPICSRMGLTVLQKGGNAVDASITVALCLGVANPASSGMGGGAFMLIHADPISSNNKNNNNNVKLPLFHDAREEPSKVKHHKSYSGKITEVIDCREVAPANANETMFADEPPLASVRGGLAIGVPGELRGLELAHARHGVLPWADVVQPAVDLARQGVPINANLAHEINIEARKYRMRKNRDGPDYGLRALLTHNDDWSSPLKEGQLLKNEALTETLEAVRDNGADALYKGPRAKQLASDIQAAGGIVSVEDIESYQATLRSPVVAHDISGFSIVGVPPPSSGGAAIIGAARFLAGYESPLATFSETLSRHRTVEALKHAFAIRMSLSDPAFHADTVRNATADLTTGSYIEELRRATLDAGCLPLSQYGGSKWAQLSDSDGAQVVEDANEGDRRSRRLHQNQPHSSFKRLSGGRRFGNLNDHGTSHFVIVDKDGNSVSMTSSVNTYFGSNVVSKMGIVLSNTMDDFSNPGRPNYFGLHPSESNFVAPNKKPLSSMSPTMVFRRHKQAGTNTLGQLALVLGASGGPKIISAVSNVIANNILLGMSLYEAVVRPRLHDQLIYHNAAVTTVENTVLAQGSTINVTNLTRNALTKRGHVLLDVDYEGTVQAVSISQEDGAMRAVCDLRKGGSPAGK